jgi:hypothetical protein
VVAIVSAVPDRLNLMGLGDPLDRALLKMLACPRPKGKVMLEPRGHCLFADLCGQ